MLSIQPLDEPVGALVSGWEPEQALDLETQAQILSALRDHLVLVFRGHEQPSDAALVRFASAFGPLIKGSEWFREQSALPEILAVTNAVGEDGIPLGTGGSAELEWHADYSYVPNPGKESFLNAVELPADGPRTYFCSQYAALESLPEDRVKELRSLRAHHSITRYYDTEEKTNLSGGFAEKRQRDEQAGVERPAIPEAEHPVVLRHPDTGRELLYVSKGATRRVLGMPRDESNALLKELHLHSTRPEAVYAHEWEVGDFVVFDTLGALHRRDAWDSADRRVMRQLSTSVQ